MYTLTSEFLISSYGASLAQRASYLALLWAVNYDYIVTNSINALIIGSRCIPNGAHTNHRSNLAHALRRIKNSDSRTYSPEANKDNICTCTQVRV